MAESETLPEGPPEDPPEGPPEDPPEGPPGPRGPTRPETPGPAHPRTQGPSPARPGPDFRNLGTWKSRNLESNKISKLKILKIQIRSAQDVGKVWMSRNKNPRGPIWCHFRQFDEPEKTKTQTGNHQNQNPRRPKCRQGLDW